MHPRHLFVILLATVLVGRTLHCCYVEAALCRPAGTSDPDSRPLTNPNDNDPNETGCICKGAVLKAPAPLEAVRSQLEAFNPLAGPAEPAALAPLAPDVSSRPLEPHLLGPPPLGGRALRPYSARC